MKKPAKVINLMDALRKSVQTDSEPDKASANKPSRSAKSAPGRKLSLVPKSSKTKGVKPARKRKSA